jgi:HAD superfamily hydrolase (TIGR01549 family)
MKYKAVLFDVDDTLVKTWEPKWAQHKMVAKRYYGLDLTDEDILLHWGKPHHVMIDGMYRSADDVEHMIENFLRHEDEYPKTPHPEAVEVVTELLDAGMPVGVITAMLRRITLKDLREQGFPYERFAVIQSADDTDTHKPDPAVFLPALQALKLTDQTGAVLYIGDGLSDFVAARGAGMDFVGVTTGRTTAEQFADAGAISAPTLREAYKLVMGAA